MAEHQTLRYFADSRITLGMALIKLLEYARDHAEDFEVGPLSLATLVTSGLTISGPDLTGPAEVLSRVPGLVEVAT